ncbi:hypothetical protein ACEUCY_19355 [Aeromonas caviae]
MPLKLTIRSATVLGSACVAGRQDQGISGLTPSFTTTFMPLKLTTRSATVLGSAGVAGRQDQGISGLLPSFTTAFMLHAVEVDHLLGHCAG